MNIDDYKKFRASITDAQFKRLCDQCREKLAEARAKLGHDLCGYSTLDLLADNFAEPLCLLREVLTCLNETKGVAK